MMTDHDVEARLRDALTTVASATIVEERPVVRFERSPSQTTARHRMRPGSAVAAGFVVALIAIGAVALLPRGGTAPPAPPATSPVVIDERFPVMPRLPDGTTVWGNFSVPDPTAPDHIDIIVGMRTNEGFERAVTVSVWDRYPFVSVVDGDAVVINGAEGVAIDPGQNEDPADHSVIVLWPIGDLWAYAHDPQGDLETVVGIAEALSINSEAGFDPDAITVGALPDDLTVLAGPQAFEPQPQATVNALFGNSPESAYLGVSLSPAASPEAAAAYAGSGTAIEVRGRPGYLIENPDTTGLVWEEAPGTIVALGASSGHFTLSELLAIADDVTFVDEAAWRVTYDVGVPPIPTTTSGPSG